MSDQALKWIARTGRFLRQLDPRASGLAPSKTGGPTTLYGTCYSVLTDFYLGGKTDMPVGTRDFIRDCQDPETGLMAGPEQLNFEPRPGTVHDREHLLWHSTCTAMPVCRQFGLKLPHPVHAAHKFCDRDYLQQWLEDRDLKQAWLEGNNILFVGQMLVYLREVELYCGAAQALQQWFRWLDDHADPATSLWGTDGHCSPAEAVYGGYHQLLVYYAENHPIRNASGLVDTVLALQHADGGFNPNGNGGGCEDVDCVDILVNLYKRQNYRRAEIRCALRQCLRHILDLQNPDGGFPYNRDCPQSHMGIPGTEAGPNQSTTFATWFRVHTLALMAEVLTDEPALRHPFRFTNNVSMGWHEPWDKRVHALVAADRKAEAVFTHRHHRRRMLHQIKRYCGPALRIRQAARRLMAATPR